MIIDYPKDYVERVQKEGVDFSLLSLLLAGNSDFPSALEKDIRKNLFSLMSKIKTKGNTAVILFNGLKDTTTIVKVFLLREKVLEVKEKVSRLSYGKVQLSDELIADLGDIINSGMVEYSTVVCLQQFLMFKSENLNYQNQATGYSRREQLKGHLSDIYKSLVERKDLISLFEIGVGLNQIKGTLGSVLMAEDISTIERLYSLVMLAAEGKSYVEAQTVNNGKVSPSRKN